MPSILVADDHAVVRAGYRRFLTADGYGDIGEASTGADVLKQLRARPWNILLLDINLPDRAGMGVLQEAHSIFPLTRILVISGLPEDLYAIEALRAGAAGFLPKDCAPNELVIAVRRVLSGQRYISSRIMEQMAADVGKPTTPRHEQLSARERQVFDGLAAGATITAIAQELDLSVKTVSTYKTRILEKMSLQSNADMTAYAFRHGLTSSDPVDTAS